MIRLDDDFLAEVGLADLPEDERKALLTHVFKTLETRVGTILVASLSDPQLIEFEAIVDRNDEVMAQVLDRYFPEWRQRVDVNDDTAVSEMASYFWLKVNSPDHSEIVQREFAKLSAEIREAAPVILAGIIPGARDTLG